MLPREWAANSIEGDCETVISLLQSTSAQAELAASSSRASKACCHSREVPRTAIPAVIARLQSLCPLHQSTQREGNHRCQETSGQLTAEVKARFTHHVSLRRGLCRRRNRRQTAWQRQVHSQRLCAPTQWCRARYPLPSRPPERRKPPKAAIRRPKGALAECLLLEDL